MRVRVSPSAPVGPSRTPAPAAGVFVAPSRRLRRALRALLLLTAAGIAAGAAALFVAAHLADRVLNGPAPAAAPAVPERARRLHATLEVVDLHADPLLWGRDLLARGRRGAVDLPRLREGNVALTVFSAVTRAPAGGLLSRRAPGLDLLTPLVVAHGWPPRTWHDATERALLQAARFDDAVRRAGGDLVPLRDAAGLAGYFERRRDPRAAAAPSVTAGLLAIEGLDALEGDPARLERLHAAGFRLAGVAHFADNAFAGAAWGRARGGLTPAGRALLRRLEERGWVVDLAHASPATVDDVLALATRPVLVSHTGVRGTCDGARNLDDARLRRVAARGGLVGIGLFPFATCGRDLAAAARALRHARDVAGIEALAIGSDFDGAVRTPIDAAGMPALTAALLDAGFSEDEVRAVMGGNARRFLAAALR